MQPQPEFNSYYNNSSSNSKSKTATTKTANNNKSKQQESEEAATAPKLQQQQQQQQQSEKQSNRTLRTTTKQQQQQQPPRVIKSKQPLINFRFYLDIRDHQLTKYIEKQIQLLGGTQEFFLDANITHFVTDKAELPANVINNTNNNNSNQPITPTTPVTPQTPSTIRQANSVSDLLEFKNAATNKKGNTFRVAQTRANAILSRVRVQSNSPAVAVSSPTIIANKNISDKSATNYIVWQTEYAVRFLKKVQHELKAYLQPENRITTSQRHKTGATGSAGACGTDITPLKGGYIKFESLKLSCRPYYHSFRAPYFDWPKVSLKSEDGAFSLTANKPLEMTRKSRSRSSQCATPLEVTIPPLRKTINTPIATVTTPTTVTANKTQCRQIKDSTDKQCGICEICKVEYDTLTIHLKTKDHEYFARNTQNFIALDTLIQSSADVNKFLAEEVENNMIENKLDDEMEQMEIEVEEDGQEPDPLEQPLATNNLSPPLRERSKRSTKGKHSSEKFQNKRNKTTKATPTKIAPKTLHITPTKNNNNNNNNTTTRRKPTNSSSPIRPFPPPSSLYKVVETSQVETTPRRGVGGVANVNENVTASPSLIVKIKKVRNTALLRLNGEAESFMFPKTTRRASSDLPTDVDRQSSSERLRNSIYSSSSLDSSSISDIVVNLESPELNKTTITTITPKAKGRTKGAQTTRKKLQCFQSAPIQPNEQLKSLRKSNKTGTPKATKTKLENKLESAADIADLSPPSAAAAIVAATAKITLPAATRKSSRMATAIVSAATTSSRLLRAAAEVMKKSGRNSSRVKAEAAVVPADNKVKEEKQEKEEETTIATASSKRRPCRLSADLAVVKMEDRMGDSDETNTDHEHLETKAESEESVKKSTRTRRMNKSLNLKRATTKAKSKAVAAAAARTQSLALMQLEDDDDFEDEDDDYEVDNDDKADKDFKCRRTTIKPRSRRGKRKKSRVATVKKLTNNKNNNNNNNNNNSDKNDTSNDAKPTKSSLHYDYTTSEKIKEQNYAFERVPETDLWYRVFKRQDNCEEAYFEYYASTKYHKLPYEMGPIPYTHTKLSTNCCKLCQPQLQPQSQSQQCEELKKEETKVKSEKSMEIAEKSTQMTTTTPYALKHKKLHLLQRYRQEQEALLQEKLKEKEQQDKQEHCYTKSVNLSQEVSNGIQSDLERCERAGSIHSTSSSCASTGTTQLTKKAAFRNKLLQKAALLNLELPPRKSPREHASTLALVSIIKQRQESKPNSDAEEIANSVPTTPIPKEEPSTATPTATMLPNNSQGTRAAAVTPIEEMCFATEISENVKRMRRGRNKYDHSPPYVVHNTKRLVRQKLNKTTTPTLSSNVEEKEMKTEIVDKRVAQIRKPRRSYAVTPSNYVKRKAATPVNMLHSKTLNLPPSVRKIGQKKGVLEFSMDDSALKALDVALEPEVNLHKLVFEIDNFLENTGKELDMEELTVCYNLESEEATKTALKEPTSTDIPEQKEQLQTTADCFINTPPATDYFSSDFDLCDLLQDAHNSVLIGEAAKKRSRESKHLSVYNTMALKKYFRKRKYMKSNRTGWPKLQKKKYSMRHQTLIANELKKQSVAAAKAVITPPDSEGDAIIKIEAPDVEHLLSDKEATEVKNDTEKQQMKAESDEERFYVGAASIPEEEETVLDSIVDGVEIAKVETEQIEEYEKAVEADDEDEFNNDVLEERGHDENTIAADKKANGADDVEPLKFDEMECADEEEEEEEEEAEPKAKRCRRNSSLGKALANCLTNNDKGKEADDEDEDMLSLMATTSTPSTNLTRSCRRTPQLNGSLISCNSPSERAGDNSDIFTVSSDGLDTDLDLSNPHAHTKEEQQNVSCNNRKSSGKSTKYDITKYVKNPAANTCAAEAATAAAKSLAIAQFLKKEVRVTCRRIRAPFRRFRYRR